MGFTNWDDLRFVLAVTRAGSLKKAAALLRVDHTTVGRRVDAAEEALGARLFTRSSGGLAPTADALRLLAGLRQVEASVAAVERAVLPVDRLEGKLTVTAPETFGVAYLAKHLARFGSEHTGLEIALVPSGDIKDLGRGEAEVAVRTFRSKHEDLLVKKAGAFSYGAYASSSFISRCGLPKKETLARTPLLASVSATDVEMAWLKRLHPGAQPSFTCDVSLALAAACRAGAGLAILPRYLGDADAELVHVPLPDPPSSPLWLTVHRDLRRTPRVRALLDFLARTLRDDAALLAGR